MHLQMYVHYVTLLIIDIKNVFCVFPFFVKNMFFNVLNVSIFFYFINMGVLVSFSFSKEDIM